MTRSNPFNSIALSKIAEQLLTEIPAEQAAIVEGGLTVKIHSYQCLKARADGFFSGKDDTYVISGDGLRSSGVSATSVKGMDSGDSRTLNTTWRNSKSSLRIDLFDQDGNFGNSDDHLGGFTATSTNGQILSKEVSGSGSKYRIFYSAF